MKVFAVFCFACIVMIVGTAPAHAYLDPAAGSLVLQLVLGGVAGLLVLLKLFWHRILSFLRIRKPAAAPTEGVGED